MKTYPVEAWLVKQGSQLFFKEKHISKRQSRFMEKKIKKTSQDKKSFSYSHEEKTIILTIVVALVIIIALLFNLILTPTPTEKFSTIYYLNSEKQTENLPKTVILGENSTFSLWIGVENHNETIIDYSVYVKYDDGKSPVDPSPVKPTESFNRSLANGELWEFPVTISIEELGSNRVIFELWFLNTTSLEDEYTGNWVNLSVEAS
jgi:uncharacterized membrane protein